MITHLGDVRFRLDRLNVQAVDTVKCCRRVFSGLQGHPRYAQQAREQYRLLRSYGIEIVDRLWLEGVLVSISDNCSENTIEFWSECKLKAVVEVQA